MYLSTSLIQCTAAALALESFCELREAMECTSGCMSEVLRTLPARLSGCICPHTKTKQFYNLLTTEQKLSYDTSFERYRVGEKKKETMKRNGQDR